MLLAVALLTSTAALAFDPTHAAWTALLARHVQVIDDGNASRVDYHGFLADREALDHYTESLRAVTPAEFKSWGKADRMAFLINAYNAHTVQLILSRYPNLTSIKDLGGWFASPWKQNFFSLFGRSANLDEVESLLRQPGVYDDPRIHFAINCASIGCPMLRNEAYIGTRLDQQLDEAMRHFLSDRGRNRYDAPNHTLEVSKIFDWYAADFSSGHHGFTSVTQLFATHADQLAASPAERAQIRSAQVTLVFLSYDWRLNDVRH